MIFGVNLPNYSTLGNRDSMIAIAQGAEQLGYSSLWTSDHVLIPASLPEPFGNVLETFTTLSYLAASTERIRLATGIVVLPMRDPVVVAKQAATLDHLSGGRFTLGVGIGWIAGEYSFLRADFGNRGQLADEYVQAIRALFDGERPEYHGAHINYSDALFSPRPKGSIPIVVGGNSNAALRRAATLGDGWYGLRLSPESARDAVATIDSLGHRAGFTVSLRVQVKIGRAVEDADPETTLHGDTEAILGKLRQYRRAGIQQLVIEPLARDLDGFLEQMRLFAQEVVPGLD